MTTPATKQPAATAAYARLSEIAARLRGPGSAASIGTLAPDIAAARQAYAACLGWLAAVRAEIDHEIAAVEADAETSN